MRNPCSGREGHCPPGGRLGYEKPKAAWSLFNPSHCLGRRSTWPTHTLKAPCLLSPCCQYGNFGGAHSDLSKRSLNPYTPSGNPSHLESSSGLWFTRPTQDPWSLPDCIPFVQPHWLLVAAHLRHFATSFFFPPSPRLAPSFIKIFYTRLPPSRRLDYRVLTAL